MSRIDMSIIPLLYKARHLPKGKKKAVMAYVREDQVFDVPHWDEADAPVVARIVGHGALDAAMAARYSGYDTEYRVARGLDGTARLVAPALSYGADPGARALEPAPPQLPQVERLLASNIVRGDLGTLEPTPAVQLGKIVASSRAASLQGLRNRMAGAVVINEQLWVPVSPPSWSLVFHGGQEDGAYVHTAVVVPRPMGFSRFRVRDYPWDGGRVPTGHLQEPEEVFRQLSASVREGHDNGSVETLEALQRAAGRPFLMPCQVEVFHPEALAYDALWSFDMREMVRQLAKSHQPNIENIMDEEAQSYMHLRAFAQDWPEKRSPEVVKHLATYVRALHSLSPSSHKESLDRVDSLVKALQTIRPPQSLDRTLPFQLPSIEDIRAPAPAMGV